MKKYIIYLLLMLFSPGIFAQGLYNNGAKIVVGSGTFLTIGGPNGNYLNETNVTPASVDLSGTVTVTGNVTNNVANADVLGVVSTGNMVFNGTTPQTLGGITTVPFIFPNLTVNNTTGVVLSNSAQVNGNLTFTTGLLTLGKSDFTFGPLSVVMGVPSPTSMIYTSGTGQVKKVWAGTGTFTFPIGNNATEYSPVSLSFTSGTFAPGGLTGVNVTNTKYNDPSIAGSYLNRYWNLTETGITGFSCDAVFQYLPSDVTGTESSIKGVRVTPTPITSFNPANTVLHQLSVTGLTSFSTFTGAVTDKTLTLDSVMLQGLYLGKIAGVMTMRQAMGPVLPHCPAGVADSITVELHSATLYSTIVYTTRVPLSITGTATLLVPSVNNGSYYITLKHRNSLETTTAVAVPFSGNSITQSFGSPKNVFGGNLQVMTDGRYTVFAGDVNQDGVIDTGDMTPIANDSFNFMGGYLTTDVNGDGVIDTGDMTNIINNSNNFVQIAHP